MKLLFQLIIFLLPTQLAYHFWPKWSLIFGLRVDYLAPAVYLTDILILLYLVFWIKEGGGISVRRFLKKHWVWIIFFATYALSNILFAARWQVALFKWGKVFELFLFSFSIAKNKNIILKDALTRPLLYSVGFFSLIGAFQVLRGGSLGGVFYWLGERTFNISTPGIALAEILGKPLLRAYSTFSHPNSLAGYLLVSFFLLLSKKETRLFSFLILIALALTFSLGTVLALLFCGVMSLLFRKKVLEEKLALWILVFSVVASFIFTLRAPITPFLPESFLERLALLKAAGRLFSQNPLTGIGLNNFIVGLSSPQNFLGTQVSWLRQPVHNIFLLTAAEGGVVGLLVLSFLIYKGLLINLKLKRINLALCLFAILFTGLFDHYWLTLEQNRLLFSLILGLSFRKAQR